MRRRVNQFSDDLKLKIVKEYFETDQSIRELSIKYGFGSGGTIYKWIRKFDISKPDYKEIHKQTIMSNEIGKSKHELELESKLKKLESELAYERLRTEALNTMIDIAEDKFEISIRKKSGTKQ